MKLNIKILAICALSASTLVLTACSHENPLTNASKKQSVAYLYGAASYAGEPLTAKQTLMKKEEKVNWYIYCMDKSKKAKDCSEIYKRMADFFKKSPINAEYYAEFKDTTAADFSDPAMWEKLGSALKAQKNFKDLDE
ncbi:MAG: hypothetical protein CMF49_03805 [Legionellales bacterium]|nr:hypothetical protein [Legionellales bacterium]|tara:strand:+ start:121 stop:534 length:414 start_codon:yes stop_codon:yes gene_type:complete